MSVCVQRENLERETRERKKKSVSVLCNFSDMASMPLGPHHHQQLQPAPLPLPLPLPPSQLQEAKTVSEAPKTTAASGVSDMDTDKVKFHFSLQLVTVQFSTTVSVSWIVVDRLCKPLFEVAHRRSANLCYFRGLTLFAGFVLR